MLFRSVVIKDEETPKAESALSWAFINLLMMVLTAGASLVLLLVQIMGRKRKTYATDGKMTRTSLIRLFSLLPALISIVAFFITQNIMNPMILFDKWTLMMVLIAAVQVVVVVLSAKKFETIEENIQG